MKPTTTLALSALVAALSGCSSMKTTSDLQAEYDFTDVDSYEWVRASDKILAQEDTYASDLLLLEIDKLLTARNWDRVYTSDEADIQITYFIKLKEHEEYSGPSGNEEPRLTGGVTFSRDSGNWSPSSQDPDLNVYTVETGTLNLNIRNAETEESLWAGTLTTRIDRSIPIEKQIKFFEKIARKIEAQIPEGTR